MDNPGVSIFGNYANVGAGGMWIHNGAGAASIIMQGSNGNVAATSFTGDGSGLSNVTAISIGAGAFSSGTLYVYGTSTAIGTYQA